MSIPGIDVSNWQGAIDWQQVKASGIQFAAAKCTEGTNYIDPDMPANWAGMKAEGLARIAYHFARPSKNSAAAEANFFLMHLPELEVGDCVALDMEDTGVPNGVNLLNWTLTWLSLVSQSVDFRSLFYSGLWFMQPHDLTGSDDLAQYGLWLADYTNPNPPTPPNWAFIAMHQTGQGNVPGIAGAVDLDTFHGTIEQLRAYGKQAPTPPPDDPCAALQAKIDQFLQDELSGRNRIQSAISEINQMLGHGNAAIEQLQQATEDVTHG